MLVFRSALGMDGSPRPKTSTLVDDFTAGTISNPPWLTPGASVTVVGGQARLAITSSYDGELSSYLSAYDLTSSSVFAKITPPTQTGSNGTREFFFETEVNGSNTIRFYMSGSNTLVMRRTLAGVHSDAGITYDPVAHAYWRIREDAGTIYWDTSPDGATWTNRRSLAHSMTLDSVRVRFFGGYYGTETADFAFVDKINVGAALPGQGSATGTVTTSGSAAGKRTPKATATGTATATGSTAGVRIAKATATGTVTTTGSATGKRTPKASSTGTVTTSGSATGQRAPKATAVGTVTTTGSAAGLTTRRGSATGTVATAGSASGKRTPKATATGTVTTTGSATGRRQPKATATGTVTTTGSATGTAPLVGQNSGVAVGTVTTSGSAVGRRLPKATATGTSSTSGAAVGRRIPKATAIGTTTTTGSAVGTVPADYTPHLYVTAVITDLSASAVLSGDGTSTADLGPQVLADAQLAPAELAIAALASDGTSTADLTNDGTSTAALAPAGVLADVMT